MQAWQKYNKKIVWKFVQRMEVNRRIFWMVEHRKNRIANGFGRVLIESSWFNVFGTRFHLAFLVYTVTRAGKSIMSLAKLNFCATASPGNNIMFYIPPPAPTRYNTHGNRAGVWPYWNPLMGIFHIFRQRYTAANKTTWKWQPLAHHGVDPYLYNAIYTM